MAANRSRIKWLGLLLASAAGCGGIDHHPVSGEVTWEGKPLEKGTIAFIAEDGKTSEAVGAIVAGRYETQATVGWKRVEIYADRSAGYDKVMQQEIRVPLVTAEYNAESKLRFEVKPGRNDYDLRLPNPK